MPATTMPPELVTVLLPTYNAALYLRERLDSIVNQTCGDWRIVVYDSYSTDETVAIVAEYQKRYRIDLLQGPKEGIYIAWNVLRRHVRGAFCYIATADDTMSPTFIADGLAALNEHSRSAAFVCAVEFIDAQSRSLSFQMSRHAAARFLRLDTVELQRRDGASDILLHVAADMLYVSMTAFLFRASDFMAAGDFRTDLGSTADREWTMRFLSGRSVVYTSSKLATWRVHAAQATAKFDVEAEINRRELYEIEILQYGVMRGYWDGRILHLWEKSRRLARFLLRVEYRRQSRWKMLFDVTALFTRHPVYSARWIGAKLLRQNYCHRARAVLGHEFLAYVTKRSC